MKSLTPNNKAYGLYSLPVTILECARHILKKPLAEIFNISLAQGKFPSKLKTAKVIPIYKTDDETDPSNYRPISLLSNLNRIFEKLMYSRLIKYIDKHNILDNSQYSFRAGSSKLFSCAVFLLTLRKLSIQLTIQY